MQQPPIAGGGAVALHPPCPQSHHQLTRAAAPRAVRWGAGTENFDAITAICVSPKKDFVAIAERDDSTSAAGAWITVVNLKNRKAKRMHTAEVQSKEYVHMCFSPDGKELLALGADPVR